MSLSKFSNALILTAILVPSLTLLPTPAIAQTGIQPLDRVIGKVQRTLKQRAADNARIARIANCKADVQRNAVLQGWSFETIESQKAQCGR